MRHNGIEHCIGIQTVRIYGLRLCHHERCDIAGTVSGIPFFKLLENALVYSSGIFFLQLFEPTVCTFFYTCSQ